MKVDSASLQRHLKNCAPELVDKVKPEVLNGGLEEMAQRLTQPQDRGHALG